MNILVHIFVFLVTAFVFLHVRYQLKTATNLEIYEIDYSTNDHLQMACDSRFPVVFDAPAEFVPARTASSKHQMNINVNTFAEPTPAITAVPVSLRAAQELMSTKRAYSARNSEFLEETEIATEEFARNDPYLRPTATLTREYDILFGSSNVATPLEYHLDYRRFFYVARGQVKFKLAAWKNEKHLFPVRDFLQMRFSSAVDPWQPQPKHEAEFEKVKFVEFTVSTGKIVFVPPYCWYSIMFMNSNSNNTNHQPTDETNTSADQNNSGETESAMLQMYSYRTAMNYIAITPAIAQHHIAMTLPVQK